MNADQQIKTVQANGFTSFFGDIFKGIFTGDQAKQQEQSILSFTTTAIGKLAEDAVVYASTLPAGGQAKRDEAIAKLKTDAIAAGHQLEGVAGSTLIWFIETALQAAIAKGLVMAVTAIAASSDDEEVPADDRE